MFMVNCVYVRYRQPREFEDDTTVMNEDAEDDDEAVN